MASLRDQAFKVKKVGDSVDSHMLSMKCGVDVYVYNKSGSREIDKRSKMDVFGEKYGYTVMKDGRLGVKDIDVNSSVCKKNEFKGYCEDKYGKYTA